MNIFILDECPVKSAVHQCDKHVVKMCLETAQMLCAAFEQGEAPYRRTHYNHPCTVWARTSPENYEWLLRHGFALCGEYYQRYGKHHKCLDIITWCAGNMDKIEFPENGLTPFAQAMPDEYKNEDPVTAYRSYYLGDKAYMATWKQNKPEWWEES
jgi:hypothetical protein